MNWKKILGYAAIIGLGIVVYSQWSKVKKEQPKVSLKKEKDGK